MKNKKFILIIVGVILLLAIVCIVFAIKGGKEYNIKITIPAGSTEAFIYSNEEICPKDNTITLYAGEGMGDGEIVLKPVEVEKENAYDKPTYITPGMPVKMNVEKGAWFKIGVNNIQNSSEEDIVVYITVSNVDVRILNKNEDMNTTQIEDKQTDAKTNFTDTNFSLKFLKMENKKNNMVYSPLSIKYALKMLSHGAKGNTKTQIDSVIGDIDLVKYDNIDNILSLANALYIRDTYSQYTKDEYKDILLNKYNAEIKYDAFRSADSINNWIENKTFGQIKNMLKDEIVTNPNNEMFLINALAIDMAWKDKFDEKNTHGGRFYLENGNEMTATMMTQETKSNNVSYYKDSDVIAISIDLEEYENEQMEFIAIMPNNDLSNYVENFGEDTLKNITSNLTLASKTKNGLDIFIPRFSFDYELSLDDDLKTLGITDAFDENLADFSNMSSKRPLWVGGALHKANIDFTEKGVKASAVTVIYMADEAIMLNENKPIEVKINKPFMYLIRDKKTDEIWFVGTVYEPNSWEKDKTNYEYR